MVTGTLMEKEVVYIVSSNLRNLCDNAVQSRRLQQAQTVTQML